MVQSYKKTLAALSLGIMALSSTIRAADVLMTVPITAGTVTISAPTALAFQPFSVAFGAQIVAESFTGVANYFIVTDLKGINSGYSTTLQMAGNLTTTGATSIASTNVAFRSNGTTGLLLSGTANPNVLIDAATASYQALNTARTFIYRSPGANTGVLSQYYQTISMQITVPAAQPAGNYTGTMVFTLIEN